MPRPYTDRMGRPFAATGLAAAVFALAAWSWWAIATTIASGAAPVLADQIAFTLIAFATAALGVVVAWRARRNIVGMLLVVVALCQILLVARDAWYWLSFTRPDLLAQPGGVALALTANLGASSFVAVAFVLAFFPSGRLPGPRWRWLLGALAAASVALVAAGLVSPWANFAPYEDVPPLVTDPAPAQIAFTLVATAAFLGLLLTTIVLALVRVRRAEGVEKAQLRWVVLGSCLFLFFPVVCGTEVLVTGSPQYASLAVAYLGMVSLPLGVAIGMLRHDLFDVDRALGAAVTWALVATGLGVVFAVVIAIGGAVVGGGSPVVAAIATAVCAVLLLPGYRWVHRRVGARLYPMRRAALGAVEALELEVATGQAAPERLATALAAAVRDPGVAVGFILPGTNEPVDVDGFVVSDPRGVAILAAGEPIGTLVMPSASSSLTREVAAASVMLVNVVRLRLHASQSLREVEASRARLVAAEDAARRRFERDLHDGAQQRLVSLGMSLRLAQRRIAGGGSVDIADLLDGAVAELGTAIAELRRLAHGIRPSVLDDGLAAAVESLARIVPLPVELSIDDTDAGVSESVVTTAYYVIAESLANAVKHAEAEAISVRVHRGVDLMRVTVSDDGRGGADAAGAGIAGLGDRVAAAGGSLRVMSERASGTTIEAELPCA